MRFTCKSVIRAAQQFVIITAVCLQFPILSKNTFWYLQHIVKHQIIGVVAIWKSILIWVSLPIFSSEDSHNFDHNSLPGHSGNVRNHWRRPRQKRRTGWGLTHWLSSFEVDQRLIVLLSDLAERPNWGRDS